MSGGNGALTQLGHPPRGRLPFPLPTGQVSILDPGRGGKHLAQIGPEVAGEPGRAQRLKGKGLIVEQELHRALLNGSIRHLVTADELCHRSSTSTRYDPRDTRTFASGNSLVGWARHHTPYRRRSR
ncbi:MAG: hypothetical protein JWP83_3803 [Mycobacterium sp.]|nr:hypothetical protein [Mycobacterium sp.]